MTLEEMRRSDKVMLSPADVCGVLKCHPYSINVQAKEDITKLPFPCFMLGTRVRIPRTAFIEWCELMKIGAQPRELKRRE